MHGIARKSQRSETLKKFVDAFRAVTHVHGSVPSKGIFRVVKLFYSVLNVSCVHEGTQWTLSNIKKYKITR